MVEETFSEMINRDITGSLTFILVSYKDFSDVHFRKVGITTSLRDDFIKINNRILKTLSKKLETNDLYLVEYDPGYVKNKNDILYLRSSTYDHINKFFQNMPDVSDIENFSPADTEFISNLKFYCFVIQPNSGSEFYSFQRSLAMNQLLKGDLKSSFFANNLYGTSVQPLLLYNSSIDCFTYGEYLFILNTKNFNSIFHFYEIFKEKAAEIIRTSQLNRLISNFSQFSDDCLKYPGMYMKLVSIGTKIYTQTLTIDKIQQNIQINGIQTVRIVNNGSRKMEYLGTNKWDVMKILDDSYVKSDMTGERYIANSKIPTRRR